jgi:hypothetical protein
MSGLPCYTAKDNIEMATKARGSQSTQTISSRGQNRPDPGGKAGAGKAAGEAAKPLAAIMRKGAPTRKK